MFVVPRKVVGWCLSLRLLLEATPALAAFSAVPTRSIPRSKLRSASAALHVASTSSTKNPRPLWNGPQNKKATDLSPVEAAIDSQWKALQQQLNGEEPSGRATFSIPREVPSGTHSIETSYGIHQTQGTDEEMAAAMDLILLSKEERGEPRPNYDFGGPLRAAMNGAIAALTALSYVLGETTAAIQDPDDKSRQSLAKISRSFQGVVELSKEFVKSLFSVVVHKSLDESGAVNYSATLPVLGEESESKQENKGTIAISNQEDDQWRKARSNVGLWTDHVAHTTASTASNVAEQVGSITNEIAQGTVDSTFAFQKSMTIFFEIQEDKTTTKPKAFYFANKSPSLSVYPTGHHNALPSGARNGTLYFTTA